MKFNLKRLAMTAMLLSSTSMSFADDGPSSSVGDLAGFGEDAYFEAAEDYIGDEDEDVAQDQVVPNQDPLEGDEFQPDVYQENAFELDAIEEGEQLPVAQASVSDSSPLQQAWSTKPEYAPVNANALQPAGYNDGVVMHEYTGGGGYAPAAEPFSGLSYGGDCDGCCDSGCDSCCVPSCDDSFYTSTCRLRCSLSRCDIRKKMFDCDSWATFEALLWFPQSREMPVLVASADPGEVPILSPGGALNGDVNNLFGGDVDGGLSAGFRADYGKWIHKNFGIGGRFWWIDENSDSFAANNATGINRSIGRPFFETNPGAFNGIGESALLVAFADGNSQFVGDIAVESELEMWAAEAYGRFRMGCSNRHQLDFIGGYSHFEIEDKLRIASSTTTIVSGPLDPPPGTVRTFDDFIKAENEFNGGQLGFELTATRGCWMVRSLTKVHLGNVNQVHTARGRSTNGIIGGPAPAEFDIGMLVQDGNDGRFERDVFTFVPEANFKLAYRFRPNVLLSVGYSFIYFDDVAQAGNTIDRAIDGPLLGTGVSGVRPSFVFNDSSLWVQGIDLGAVIDF